jgi:hypothetical protein
MTTNIETLRDEDNDKYQTKAGQIPDKHKKWTKTKTKTGIDKGIDRGKGKHKKWTKTKTKTKA